MNDDMIGTAEAAKLLGRSHRTIKRWAQQGLIPHTTKLAGSRGAYLFNRQTIERLADQEGAP